jgi:hypothetical protein
MLRYDNVLAARPEVGPYLNRHVRGDWGACCPEDCRSNDVAVRDGWHSVKDTFVAESVRIWRARPNAHAFGYDIFSRK